MTNLDDAVLRLIPASTGALKLLVNYVGMLEDDEALATPALRQSCRPAARRPVAAFRGCSWQRGS